NKTDSGFVLFADNDLLWPFEHRAKQRTDSGRSCAENQDRIIFRNFGDTNSPEPGGKDIADKQRLFIGYSVGNPVQSRICKRHAHILCLSAVNAAAERPASVFISTVIDKAFFTEKAFSAEGLHID